MSVCSVCIIHELTAEITNSTNIWTGNPPQKNQMDCFYGLAQLAGSAFWQFISEENCPADSKQHSRRSLSTFSSRAAASTSTQHPAAAITAVFISSLAHFVKCGLFPVIKTPTDRFVRQFFHLHPNTPNPDVHVAVGRWTWCLKIGDWKWKNLHNFLRQNDRRLQATGENGTIMSISLLYLFIALIMSQSLLLPPRGPSQSQLSTERKLAVQDATAEL